MAIGIAACNLNLAIPYDSCLEFVELGFGMGCANFTDTYDLNAVV